MQKERIRTIPEVYVIFRKGNEALFLRRFNTTYANGKLSVVAGHPEDNEGIIPAAIREAKEEAGVDIAPEDMFLVHAMYRPNAKGGGRTGFFFEAAKWQGEFRNMEPEKCSELRWCSLDSIPEDACPYILEAMNCYMRGQRFSDYILAD